MATLQITQKSGSDLNTPQHGDSLINYVYPDVVSLKRMFPKNIWWYGGKEGEDTCRILNAKFKDNANVYVYGIVQNLNLSKFW